MGDLTISYDLIPVLSASPRTLTETVSPAQALHCFDPLTDGRWDTFVEQHPRSSIFHTSAWLEALRRTYGYEAIAYTTSLPDEPLDNAVIFCRIESWLTGRRLVSLPFSDHCEPLVHSYHASEILAQVVAQELKQNRWRYVECRPLSVLKIDGLHESKIVYGFHELDLRPELDVIFRGFHKNSIQRKIRRGEREDLRCSEGSASELMREFYGLFELTRRRHKLPPPPLLWFENLSRCFGPALKIRVAYKNRRAIAAMITIHHRNTLMYKYGCSDIEFNKVGSMPFLFWRSIQDAKQEGLETLDFGRTDAGQQGLIMFKNRWGAKQSVLTYSRYSVHSNPTHLFDMSKSDLKTRAAKSVISYLPGKIVSKTGQMLYRHVG